MATLLAGGAVAGTVQPSELVLRNSDLGSSFQLVRQDTGEVTNALAAASGPSGHAAQLRAWGRVSGYQVHFVHRSTATSLSSGVVDLHDSATLYATRAGASGAFAYETQKERSTVFQPATAPAALRIGDRRSFFTAVQKTQNILVQLYVLVWQRGRTVAVLEGVGLRGPSRPAQLARIARLQDARLARLGK